MGEVVASQKLYRFVPRRATGVLACSNLINDPLLVAQIRQTSKRKQISRVKPALPAACNRLKTIFPRKRQLCKRLKKMTALAASPIALSLLHLR
ncbi:hypothetical protein [Advenella kashmirensis]|uniref:hypothetical protein n=1 Tax=Advenella kashmirensis TaxID=310575 RepID=UPI0011D20DAD|nr:hypothetical protein [Advenella kashmirensis]